MIDLSQNVQDIIANLSTSSKAVDFVRVPCRPTCALPGLAFLSLKALEELKHSNRADELLPEDEVELYLFYAKHLYKAGLCKIEFPSFYKSARALFAESTATAVGSLSPFYFELGYELCSLIPEDEWPVENLRGILKEAECKRRSFLLKRANTADDTFLTGLTHDEKKLFNILSHGNSNVLSINYDLTNLRGFYGFEN
ncbi:conserved hypothetical protein [Theileria equi strain WA]|uniref:GINS subunit domain-containing protein n=1 Tax=Theileria equi strain WA TaxID=1537102 RepID=L1LBD8_THEEQ|nr:conserved hypothetical protein [Theileria equi strain WA]EKX72646.1 conserved hypothetical protein [Theileria equi strain WA]|eukprot:XP_004832098.1 conserved hypothetical protein [Theileria equi strain WA]